MQYLVAMTTHVPDGTPEETVHAVRSREAACTRRLAKDGLLLRLWRPPQEPGEWRTLGLFAAEDDAHLDTVLGSMPLHVWRVDIVAPLSEHPNDPSFTRGGRMSEFLTTLTITIPDGTPAGLVDDLTRKEAVRARELASEGRLVRLWSMQSPRGRRRTLGLWSADDGDDLMAALESLPLHRWMAIDPIPLSVHPNDPVKGTELWARR